MKMRTGMAKNLCILLGSGCMALGASDAERNHNIRIECDGSEECSVLQRSREQKAVCPPGNRCLWLAVENAKMFGNGPYATTHDFSDEPYGTIEKLTVENIAIVRTNGAPAPDCRIAAEQGTAFGELSISNVTLDGVGMEGSAR